MNIFVHTLRRISVDSSPDKRPKDLVVEDNIGEGIHIHLRNMRLEMSIADFQRFAAAVEDAQGELEHGNR